jgi:hypothetical protein
MACLSQREIKNINAGAIFDKYNSKESLFLL